MRTQNGIVWSNTGGSAAGAQERAAADVGADIFERGLCLPSDIKMTEEEQDKVIGIIRSCFV